jgi:hypothetical protein
MFNFKHLATAVVVAFLPFSTLAQMQPIPTPPGSERVTFRNTLTPKERQFLGATPALQIYRHEFLDAAVRQELYWGEVDLDGDGKPEIVLIDERSENCGTVGCGAVILTGPRGKWRIIGEVPSGHDYFVVFAERDYGWRRFESTGDSGLFWTGCRYYGGGNERELAEWPPDPCPRIHYGEGLLAKEKKRPAK